MLNRKASPTSDLDMQQLDMFMKSTFGYRGGKVQTE